jgi:hypothetical protein
LWQFGTPQDDLDLMETRVDTRILYRYSEFLHLLSDTNWLDIRSKLPIFSCAIRIINEVRNFSEPHPLKNLVPVNQQMLEPGCRVNNHQDD